MSTQSRFLIAAVNSGSGKTTLTIGLLKALNNRGLKVQPFKCGPDYIDTKFHQAAANNPSINLDTFLSSQQHIKYLFNKYSSGKDVLIAEGVMGLFDGYNKMEGSSAQIASLINTPIILVVNAKSMAYSAAAVLYGFKNFYSQINIVGVIFNFVASENHYNHLKDAANAAGIEVLGYLPKNADIETPSRHLGLSLDGENQFQMQANKIAQLVEKTVQVDKILEITRTENSYITTFEENTPTQNLKITIARDEAFNFVYHENIEYLKKYGTITFVSPLRDAQIPQTDLLYLPGGYPELYLSHLSNNKTMQDSIRTYIEDGGKTIAECGGMMYLSSFIKNSTENAYPMVGILKQTASMEHMKLKLGYRQFLYGGIELKGHEFHYSCITTNDEESSTNTEVFNAKKQLVDTKLFRYKNLIAGYTHLYWAEMSNFLDLF